ncbi:PrsW family intramembrane metalloprotease [Actinomycetaceae bacterium MB13-C1-2]|nr:PrsW family intramembrane metalloprotease [Actinomycetaceae bacterium MB13-C1-2]
MIGFSVTEQAWSERPKDDEQAFSSPWERYRLSSQRPEMEREGWTMAGPFAGQSSESPVADGPAAGQNKGRASLRNWWRGASKGELAIVLLSALGIATSMYLFVSQRDIGSVGLFALISTVPLLLVLTVLIRADRFAPIEARYVVLAALWGAGIATVIASVINSALLADFIATLGDMSRAETIAATVVAPLSEELLKGGGVILVLLICRNRIVSATNGLVIAGTAGAAFAFVENIQYFLQAQTDSSAVLGATIVGRLVLSPFIHPMATSFIGFFFASAILKGTGAWSWFWRIAVGFALAMLTHALWNGLASVGSSTWLLFYVLIEVPLFVGWLVWVSTQGNRQMRQIRSGLSSYVATGWISPAEEKMVTDAQARKYARRWARKVGRPAKVAMRKYLQTAGRLGLDQSNMEQAGPDPKRVDNARESLLALAEYRETYLHLGEIYAASSTGGRP